MITQKLAEARTYEKQEGSTIPDEQRPMFHLTPLAGWMNDPNGFSFHNGMYHLFYQYYPYDIKWGPMHWGHAVSTDLLRWTHLPAALAPDTEHDKDGCFSGSAVDLDDGRQLLMYTGVIRTEDPRFSRQVQCIAVEQNGEYVKYEGNPVLDETDLPEGCSPYDFRDPKLFRKPDGMFGCLTVGRKADGNGMLLYYSSPDGFNWSFNRILTDNDGTFGRLWECPDYFELDGKYVFLVSPMDMVQNDTFFCGNSTVCMIGSRAEDGNFIRETAYPIDCGLDFYATQTLPAPDGRRLMVAWMANWDSITDTGEHMKWTGSITLPRELHVKDGRLLQEPIRELETLRGTKMEYRKECIGEARSFAGIEGRTLDLSVQIHPCNGTYNRFEIRLAEDGDTYTSLIYRPGKGTLTFDRTRSGSRRSAAHIRTVSVNETDEGLQLRIILDRWSCEVFINDGSQVMTHRIMTDQSASGISFRSDGNAMVDLVSYELNTANL